MNSTIGNALFGYFQTLYEINQKFILLCGMNCHSQVDSNSKTLLDLVQDIFKLLPYKFNQDLKEIVVIKSDGLIEFDNDFGFLYDDYKALLNNYYEQIDKLRKVRNKFEHKMHGVREKASEDGTYNYFTFEFEIEEKGGIMKINISYGTLIGILIALNEMFTKIQYEVFTYANSNECGVSLYYERLDRVRFTDFNKLYETDLIRTIGRVMHKF